MLDIVLQFLTDQLNAYIRTRSGSSPVDLVKMGRIVNDSGKYATGLDSVAASVINIEEDRILKSQLPDYVSTNGQHVMLEPELKLNLYVLFAANFQLYDVALKYVSLILTFFQSHPSFTATEYPALPGSIVKLNAELVTLNFEQLNQIWAFIGGKQLPSVLYKVRMISLQDASQKSPQPPIAAVERIYASL